MLKLIDMYKVTAFCGTPTLLRMMARLKKGLRLIKAYIGQRRMYEQGGRQTDSRSL